VFRELPSPLTPEPTGHLPGAVEPPGGAGYVLAPNETIMRDDGGDSGSGRALATTRGPLPKTTVLCPTLTRQRR